MKKTRQDMIREIITNMSITTQSELTHELMLRGMPVTQATISRDIKELRISKVQDSSGEYKYSIPENTSTGENGLDDNRWMTLFTQGVIGVAVANNLIVLNTVPGAAHAAASAVDNMKLSFLLGCVAGDDTIIAVAKSNEDALMAEELFVGMLKK